MRTLMASSRKSYPRNIISSSRRKSYPIKITSSKSDQSHSHWDYLPLKQFSEEDNPSCFRVCSRVMGAHLGTLTAVLRLLSTAVAPYVGRLRSVGDSIMLIGDWMLGTCVQGNTRSAKRKKRKQCISRVGKRGIFSIQNTGQTQKTLFTRIFACTLCTSKNASAWGARGDR